MKQIAIIGGGAAGFFTALTAAEANPTAQVTLYERGARFLTKVKISGGGRCNVTHNCYDPKLLASHYPRGERELRAAFHRWQPQDTLNWFAARAVQIKAEADGRMFPTTDDSQTIIDCFLREARRLKIGLHTGIGLKKITVEAHGSFGLELSDNSFARADAVCIASGSLKASPLARTLTELGHHIEALAPSLFAFNVSDKRLSGLAGLAVQHAQVRVLPDGKPQSGPVLVTHRGLSGPAILRTSAWEARTLQAHNYHFDIAINWLGEWTDSQLREQLKSLRKTAAKKSVKNTPLEALPKRLWERLVQSAAIEAATVWAQLSKKSENALVAACLNGRYSVQGKTTNKDEVKDYLRKNGLPKYVPSEFVHCGGISRKEIDWRTMESKICPGLYFAGECIDIDGLTGGFNFQSAWTTAHIAGLAMGNADT